MTPIYIENGILKFTIGSYIVLPDELWLAVFHCLPAPDLCNVNLVSTEFNRIGREPKLWKNVKIQPKLNHLSDHLWESLAMIDNVTTSLALGIIETMGRSRFRCIKDLDLSCLGLLNRWETSLLLEHVKYNCTTLDRICFNGNLSLVNPALIGDVISNLSYVHLSSACINKDFIEEVLLRLNLEKIKMVDLSNLSLEKVNREVLANIARHTAVLLLRETNLKVGQLISVLHACLGNDHLEKLDIRRNGSNISGRVCQFQPNLIARISGKLSCNFVFDEDDGTSTLKSERRVRYGYVEELLLWPQ